MDPITENRFSQSELVTLGACPQKWYWQYARNLKRRGMWNWSFVVGSEFHRFLEKLHHPTDFIVDTDLLFNPEIPKNVFRDSKFEIQLAFWKTVFPVLSGAYFKIWEGKDFKVEWVEKVVTRTYRGINFTGKIDMALKEKNHIVDHKTMANMEVYGLQLHQRFQFLFYFWLSGIPHGRFTVNKIKKPALRQGKNEGDETFANRCCEDILARPEAYFSRETVAYTQEQIQHFEKKVLDPKVSKLLLILENPSSDSFLVNDRVLENCYNYNSPCAFLPLCFEDEALADIYFEPKSSKHEELEEE